MRIAIVYNEPYPSRYDAAGEEKAVLGVLHAVSAVQQALLELGYYVTRVPLVAPLGRVKRKLSSLDVDLVFNLFEGFCGRPETEALVPEALSELGIPCTGCPGKMLRLALDKAKVKVLLKAAGIPTPDFQLLNHHILHMFQLNYPCVVKPRGEDASHGLTEASVVSDFASLKKQVKLITEAYGGSALVEEFIDGREFNATVLGDSRCTVLPVSEIAYSLPSGMPRILTYAAKWEPSSPYFRGTTAICPAEIEAEARERINQTALAVFRLLDGQGYARADMRMNKEGQPSVIEVNPNPDISPDSGAVRQAEAAGMSYPQFVEKIIQLALEKKYHENQDPSDVEERQASLDENTAKYARVQGV
ncbi:MAG TPA: ATP-grasp domain-containing protein [Dehalococcoidales bacterium]|nr:ATP-grasp domain-containing protein [Dehalococcoidales bacterium]